jgi:hypothetical protein
MIRYETSTHSATVGRKEVIFAGVAATKANSPTFPTTSPLFPTSRPLVMNYVRLTNEPFDKLRVTMGEGRVKPGGMTPHITGVPKRRIFLLRNRTQSIEAVVTSPQKFARRCETNPPHISLHHFIFRTRPHSGKFGNDVKQSHARGGQENPPPHSEAISEGPSSEEA